MIDHEIEITTVMGTHVRIVAGSPVEPKAKRARWKSRARPAGTGMTLYIPPVVLRTIGVDLRRSADPFQYLPFEADFDVRRKVLRIKFKPDR
jgi:hypothetical protein